MLVWLLFAAGCGDRQAEPPPSLGRESNGSEGAVGQRVSGFTTPEQLLEHLRGYRTAADAAELLDLVYARSMVEEVLVKRLRERNAAWLAFHEALRSSFPASAQAQEPLDLGMAAFGASLETARIDRLAGRRAYAGYSDAEGLERELVLVRYRDSWWLAPETLSGGQKIDEVWFGPKQAYLNGVPNAYKLVTDEVLAGKYSTAIEAEGGLLRKLDPALNISGVSLILQPPIP